MFFRDVFDRFPKFKKSQNMKATKTKNTNNKKTRCKAKTNLRL